MQVHILFILYFAMIQIMAKKSSIVPCKEYDEQKDYLIYADTTTDKPFELTPELILKRSRRSKVKYYAKVLWFNRKKITWERIVFNVKGMLNYKK